MDPHSSDPPDTLDRELAQLLRDHADRAQRPDHRRPRGNQDIEPETAARSRDGLERVLGW